MVIESSTKFVSSAVNVLEYVLDDIVFFAASLKYTVYEMLEVPLGLSIENGIVFPYV